MLVSFSLIELGLYYTLSEKKQEKAILKFGFLRQQRQGLA